MNKITIFTFVATLVSATMQVPATAGPVNNQQLSIQSELQLQRDEVRMLLDREDVRNALLGYGVSAGDAEQRIDSMTESELRQIHGGLSSLPAGEGALGVVLTVLLILILLDVAGVTDIFPRI